MTNKEGIQRKLNIAMFGHKQIPSRSGGVEVVVEELATRMVALGNDVTCYNRQSVSGKQSSNYKNVVIKNVFTINAKGLAAVTSSFFASLKAAFGMYDVVHIHAEGPAFMCWLPKLLGKKVVVTVHGLDHQRSKWGKFASWYIRMGEKMAVRNADAIIVLSKGVQQYFLDTYKRPTHYIPNGVNKPTSRKAELISKHWGLKKDNYLLFLGRLVPEKGVHYLIEAFKNLSTDKKLVIAGSSSDTDVYSKELYEIAKKHNIIFTGHVEGQILEELYSNAYVYLLPSDVEGMPLSLLEAMSYGNCCLVSDIDECASVVSDHGLTFSKGNVEDLHKHLQILCDKPSLVEKYRSTAAEFILNKHRWDDIVNETLQLYRK